MYIDKDSWGNFSINDLTEKDLRLLYEALRVYAQHNLGRIHPENTVRMFVFDSEFNRIMQNE
uniref:Ornithine aminotransferase n=1 Tax=Prevotella sp. GTC17262 TaxID=3236797 RepID=A0AB33JE80_9BACT